MDIEFVAHRLSGDVITLVHTEVDPAHDGQGHADLVVRPATTFGAPSPREAL